MKISLKFVHRVPINNIPTLVQVMASRQPGDKPLSEPMIVRLPTHINASLGLNVLMLNAMSLHTCCFKTLPILLFLMFKLLN